ERGEGTGVVRGHPAADGCHRDRAIHGSGVDVREPEAPGDLAGHAALSRAHRSVDRDRKARRLVFHAPTDSVPGPTVPTRRPPVHPAGASRACGPPGAPWRTP